MTIQEKIVNEAKKHIGVGYVWGGESLEEGGFDCSGYVYRVLNNIGVSGSRTTAQGYFNRYANNVTNGDKSAGTLLFFGKSTNKITHIAISLGDGKMIESIGSRKNTKNNVGKGVTISNISRRKDLVTERSVVPLAKNIICPLPAYRPNLKRGSRGNNVRYLQTLLNHYFNAHLVIDGIFGNATYNALKNMQSASGLNADGIYGSHTASVFKNLMY